MKDVRGANAIVTGASKGIGVHIARALAKAGVNLSLAARSEAELEQVCTEMRAIGVKAIATRCDVTVDADRTALLQHTRDELGTLDILVNNAGVETVAHFETADEDEIMRTIDVNLLAAVRLTRAVVPGFLERKRGHVVNIASGAGKIGVPFGVAYSTSKHGLVGLTHSLRCEYYGSPVGFSVVCPGFVSDTGMYARWEDNGVRAPAVAGRSSPEKVASVVVRCITHNRAEVIVNTPPVRPLIVLANIAPRVEPALMKLFGYTSVFRRVADQVASGRGPA